MFERYITDALTTNFGHILENVDSDNMRLSVWNGELTLENVAIKTSALDTILGGSSQTFAPVEIAYGHIGVFKVKIPWSLLSSLMSDQKTNDGGNTGPKVSSSTKIATTISVVLSDVNILLTPRQKVDKKRDSDGRHTTLDSTETRRKKKERKVQSLLDASLLKRVTESSIIAAEAHEVATSGSWSTWVRDKLSQLLSNLSIIVENVHIRYEDPGTSMGFQWRVYRRSYEIDNDKHDSHSLNYNDEEESPLKKDIPIRDKETSSYQPKRYRPPFAIGITLKEFSVHSTVANGDENNMDHYSGLSLDDTIRASVISTNTAASTTIADISTTRIDDTFTIRRQHKRAAARALSIYWDNSATLISDKCIQRLQSQRKQQERDKIKEHAQQQEIKQEVFELYQSFFVSLNSTSSRHHPWAKHSYLLDPVSPSVDLTLVSKICEQPLTKLEEPLGTEKSYARYESDDDISETSRPSAPQQQRLSSQTTTNTVNSTGTTQCTIPPSSIQIKFPPCAFALSRSTLEDTVYLRKSFSVWTEAQKTLVSESSLMHVLQLRPSRSALVDPRGWWKYAFQATVVLSRMSSSPVSDKEYEEQKEIESLNENNGNSKMQKPLTRRKGWVGLVQAVSRRNKYVQLYKQLFESLLVSTANFGNESKEYSNLPQKDRKKQAHLDLLDIEDSLLAAEVVAFRIHVYESLMGAQGDDNVDNNANQLSTNAEKKILLNNSIEDDTTEKFTGSWSSWIRGEGNDLNNKRIEVPETEPGLPIRQQEKKNAMIKGEKVDDIISVEHRLWMMNEMKQALDKERENIQNRVMEGLHQESIFRRTTSIILIGDMPNEPNPITWTVDLICRQLAVQINEQVSGDFESHRSSTPVVRMSTAWVQDLSYYNDGSWDVECSLASIEVEDLISARGEGSASKYISTLLGSNNDSYRKCDDDYISINGVRYHRNMAVTVNKRLHWNLSNSFLEQDSFDERGSTTTVQIRVLPMEAVYSALPVEAVTQILSAVKTPEIIDDYHKALGVANSWRDKQKEKILDTLAHKNKKIIIDIDIAAPEILIPEDIYRPDSPMLAVNLGRFQAHNDDESLDSNSELFDDQWRISISNIQMRTTSIKLYHSDALSETGSCRSNTIQKQLLVEEFSIDFVVSTKIVKSNDQDTIEESCINISATLPRLAFNISSSAIRLISRLQRNFAVRRREILDDTARFEETAVFDDVFTPTNQEQQQEEASQSKMKQSSYTSRVFKFNFSAPAITLRLENDVDQINSRDENSIYSTPIIDLALRSISGNFVQEYVSNGDSTINFVASLQSLGIIDLYQSAGNDFLLLMSSVPQNQLVEHISTATGYSWDALHEIYEADDLDKSSRKDLVTLEYCSTIAGDHPDENDGKRPDGNSDKVSLWFYELYIEWNPETLAAIHVALRTSSIEKNNDQVSFQGIMEQPSPEESSVDAEFFDAFEEEFYEASDNLDGAGNSWNKLCTLNDSEILLQRFLSSPGSKSPVQEHFQSARMEESYDAFVLPESSTSKSDQPDKETKPRQIQVVFELSKLRVSFNKETRHRKVIVAQMDRTFVSYTTRKVGGSKIIMNLGNLIFIDPAYENNTTLYGQILGLQTKTSKDAENSFSSLLEMEVVMNPIDVRDFASLPESDKSATVTIDRERGKMTGSNCCVIAKLSPMKFVIIEQLWMEFVDYFFQGIIGIEVLGGQTNEKPPGSPLNLIKLEKRDPVTAFGSDADGISFTRFDICLDSPVIILPVTYTSPEFVRLELSKIHLYNEYDGEILNDATFDHDETQGNRMQWYNNCKVSLDDLQLFNSTRQELGNTPVVASVSLRWPTGPLAQLISPKWQVGCNFESLDISLCRSDYALLQNIISHNIGEQSRHMDEWVALQSLSRKALNEFMKRIIVHYGYDTKNVAPSTYDVKLSIPSLKFSLIEANKQDSLPSAIARCFNLKWQMRKGSDLILTQSVTCGIDLVRPLKDKSDFETLMILSNDDNSTFLHGDFCDKYNDHPGFVYSSKCNSNGDNVKTIDILDPSIYLIVPAWKRVTAFFQSLAPPIFLSKKSIKESIQVGDRWYRIGDDIDTSSVANLCSEKINSNRKRFSWISTESTLAHSSKISSRLSISESSGTYQLKILMTWPKIILTSIAAKNPLRVILRMNHVDFLQINEASTHRKTMSLFLHDTEVYTSSDKIPSPYSSSKNKDQHSLIHPWSVSGTATTCNGESIGDCDMHCYKISGDVLRARAAYSDIAIAIDVFLSLLYSFKVDGNNELEVSQSPVFSTSSSFELKESTIKTNTNVDSNDNNAIYCQKAANNVYDIQIDGFTLKVADDSGRHFSGYQDLVILSLGKMILSRHEAKDGSTSMKLWLDGFEVFDCLQPERSLFRTAASSHSDVMGIRNAMQSKEHETHSKDKNLKENFSRKMSWKQYSTEDNGHNNYKISASFLKRMNETSAECSHYLWGKGGEGSTPGFIEIVCKFTENSHQEFDVQIRSFAVQWNPSTVIAVQRFLGRLRKDSKIISGQVFNNQFDDLIDGCKPEKGDTILTDAEHDTFERNSVIRASIQIDSLTVCMNKEHQRRRLLELTFTSCHVDMHSSEQGMAIEGQLGDLSAFDNDNYSFDGSNQDLITKNNRNVLSVMTNFSTNINQQFLNIQYKTFSKKASSTSKANVPNWVKSNLPSPDDIDDFLSLNIAAIRLTYIKERTEEILDYLSNGLPGEGMGVTSRAAKGFISKRIQTRSFLQLRINSPQIFIPQHEMSEYGLALKLGDVNVQSWFEEATTALEKSPVLEWWRILSLNISGFCCGLIQKGYDFNSLSSATIPIDLQILLRKPMIRGRTLSIRGKMSCFEVTLQYQDYALLWAVVHDNIGRHINTDKWDNVEKAYWMEEKSADRQNNIEGSENVADVNTQVAYSSNARFVRYGKGGKKARSSLNDQTLSAQPGNISMNTLDVRFDMDGLALKLRRNDFPHGIIEDDIATTFHYDFVLLRVKSVEVLTTANANGDISFNLSLFRIGLFDLGDTGRLIRQRYYHALPNGDKQKQKPLKQSCPFVVLTEGYMPADVSDLGQSGRDGPEFVVSIDTCPAVSTTGFGPLSGAGLPSDTQVTIAKVVVNYLSFNALVRPFQEIAAFFSCEWPNSVKNCPKLTKVDEVESRINEKLKGRKNDLIHDFFQGFQLKVVAHYPRVFFLADESDLHSRALVLKGLAVANISIVKKKEIYGTDNRDFVDVQQIASINMDIHGLETYINPDVSKALRYSQRHSEMIGYEYFRSLIPISHHEGIDTLGVALIQPVTMGIEYNQTERYFFPTRRSLNVIIDPVSTMLSFEDLQLIEVVLNRWSSGRSKTLGNPISQPELVRTSGTTALEKELKEIGSTQYEVIFSAKLLGLGLKAEGDQTVVNSTQNPNVKTGDILMSIANESVQNRQLDQIVRLLAKSNRPITVKFERPVTLKPVGLATEVTQPNECSEEENDDVHSISCYNLSFCPGMQLGLEFARSPCGQFPVVSKVLSKADEAVVFSSSVDEMESSETIEVVDSVFNSGHRRTPRIGAVVVAVDQVPVEEIGAEEVWQVLSKMQKGAMSPVPIETVIERNVKFSLTFQETQASTWGNIDFIDISTSGMALSFIDDFNGRDMPLLRGKLNAVEIHIKRGLGTTANILDNATPSLLTPFYDSVDNVDINLSAEQLSDIQTESIVSFSVIGICSVDYFHPRVSFWEPLLESSQLFFHFEKQDGSSQTNRPAQVAVEISDRLLHNQVTKFHHFNEAQMVSVNFTDAAAEVLAGLGLRWKDWRNDLHGTEEEEIEYTDELILQNSHGSGSNLVSTNSSTKVLNMNHHCKAIEVNQHQLVRQRAAAKKAAQGALNFAQKRGAETSKKSDSAKPFIFRNRTGISIAFVQQGCGLQNRGYCRKEKDKAESLDFTATIGEYDGLENYEQQSITELADQEDARFNMGIMNENFEDDIGRRRSIRQTNKVRSYEGRYPDLMVAIQAVAGVQVEPVINLQVFKVGSTIRHLTVKKDNSDARTDAALNSIQVAWKVEIEDNRRILTLSTAVRVIAPAIPLQVGVRDGNSSQDLCRFTDSSITSIGIARPDCPFYIPLWLALKLEPISLHIRPASVVATDYSWSESSVLRFGPFIFDNRGFKPSSSEKWTWEETVSDLRFIQCVSNIDTGSSIFFSVFGSSLSRRAGKSGLNHSRDKPINESRGQFEPYDVLTVTLDSGLTIRNMLPTGIEFEVVQGRSGTHFNDDKMPSSSHEKSQISKLASLKRGESKEVFEVNYSAAIYSAAVPRLRIKQHSRNDLWSTWASLELLENQSMDEDNGTIHANETASIMSHTPSQVNVRISDGDFGIPLVLGVRTIPKLTTEDAHCGRIYGLEVVIYAELWIRNITSLPLNFGCPAYQLEPEQYLHAKVTSDDSVAKFTAETALMELASLLEVGDKGTILNQKAAKINIQRGHLIESLPDQECSELVEEVFEYVDIENSMVKRRWWASECYSGYHKQIFDVDDTATTWKWLDEKWVVDSSGGAKHSNGGWESCRNPYTGIESFGGKREFNPSDEFRRRRYYRKRSGCREFSRRSCTIASQYLDSNFSPILSSERMGEIQVFHQPIQDSFSREQKRIKHNPKRENSTDSLQHKENGDNLKIAIKCGDGKWSSPAEIPDSGTCYGVIRVLASRWPKLTQRKGFTPAQAPSSSYSLKKNSTPVEKQTTSYDFQPGCLSADLYELCYTVSDIESEWGEFSRSMEVSPRFFVRNDSTKISMKLKQSGAPNFTSVILRAGEARPFYWADFRLPKLVSIAPLDGSGTHKNIFRWSGGFDLCNLGMTPVRIRTERNEVKSEDNSDIITSIRCLFEVRPGTGGHGINVSLREEEPNGNGSLFRIENLSPLPIWYSQDGVLANPTTLTRTSNNNNSLIDGDFMPPNSKSAFALDVPYRQGKYAHRKEASLSELMHARVSLAPLSSRAGIESVKVIGLATMGETVRLNPMKLPLNLTSEGRDVLQRIRLLGVVATDGPTRVLRLCLMAYPGSDVIFRNIVPSMSNVISRQIQQREGLIRASRIDYTSQVTQGVNETIRMAAKGDIELEMSAKKKSLFAHINENYVDGGASDKIFSFRMEFSGFVTSLVDSSPSEIAVVSLRNVNALARWNSLRSADATLLLSIGWLQVDNHIPSAPFKVAVRPDISKQNENENPDSSPLLVIAVAFAPKHKSRITVIRSVTVAPRNMFIALDLAFLVRLQRFFMEIQDHLRVRQQEGISSGSRASSMNGIIAEQAKIIPFPSFQSPEKQLEQIAAFSENQKMYFQGLTILPTNIKLSVAPAKALTSDQASLEGKEMAAIHEAVRKGDVLLGGSSSGPLGVRVGRKNRTPLAVVRGVFKSIVVDALLRLSGASLNFHGVFLRNHIATSNQLSTYLAAHYLSSLKHNVPALLGSLSAIGNPLGLIRGIGDGVSDFVTEPVRGFKRSLKELDPGYAVDGVARGTESLARHTVGGLADSASLLMETFSKYMAVVTLDRRYAQKRDRRKSLRLKSDSKVTLVGGVESGFMKLIQGFREGVTGVVRAPIRGAEKRGLEGFAKGLGKGLLGLLVKPIIGITDAATDVMIGVKSTVEYKEAQRQNLALLRNQFRPRRPMYGRDKVLRPYNMEDAAAATLMLKTRCAGENYLCHLEINNRVALLSVKRLIMLGPRGEEQLALKYKHVDRLEVRSIRQEDGTNGWGIIVVLNTPRRNGSEVEVITCQSEQEAINLSMMIKRGFDMVSNESLENV